MKIVLADGCFDPLHIGHVYHLQAARKLGDKLIVALTDDANINKPGHPIFGQREREEMLRALRCVDSVIVVKDGEEAIELIRPHVYVKGVEYEGKLKEKALVESLGGRCVFVSGPVYSSSKLVTGGYLRVQSPADRGRDS